MNKSILLFPIVVSLGGCVTPEPQQAIWLESAEQVEVNPFLHTRDDPSQRTTSGTLVTELPEPGSGAFVVEIGGNGFGSLPPVPKSGDPD